MFHFKSNDAETIQQERHALIWQMLTAQLEASHEKLMTQYGMEVLRPSVTEGSMMRSPRRLVPLPAPAEESAAETGHPAGLLRSAS